MPSHLTSTHATHDELLIARLYGGDIDGHDKERALEFVATCDYCAGYFADYGSIAATAAAMRTPARPRDFALTEADAARLRRSGGAPALGWLGRLRLVGRSMAAVGVAGIVLVAAATALAPGGMGGGGLTQFGAVPVAAPAMTAAAGNVAALGSTDGPEVVGTGTKQGSMPTSLATGSLAAAADASATVAATALLAPSVVSTAAPAASAAPASLEPVPGATVVATAVSGGDRAAASAADGTGNGVTDYGTSTFVPAPAPPTDHAGDNSSLGGPDGRLLALAGFGVLILLGVLLLAAPRLAARRSGR